MTDVESPRARLADTGSADNGGGLAADSRGWPADSGLELTTAGFARAGFPGPGFEPDGAAAGPALSDRLTALARIIQIGSARSGHDGFGPELLTRAEELLARAGERLRLSADHTVVVLAGGTGSGKSSLFNRLAGADFSPVGVTRPVTRDAHACVWGDGGRRARCWTGSGSAERNRYARSSALGARRGSMSGLMLLDLPDHDSVVAGATGSANRLVALADLMVWVLDPQKYADAAVHRRYLVPLAGHSSVIAVVLNQSDLLTPQQAEDCVADLQPAARNPRACTTPGAGHLGRHRRRAWTELRQVLVRTRVGAAGEPARIAADVDALAAAVRAVRQGEAQRSTGTRTSPRSLRAALRLAERSRRPPGWPGSASALQSARELQAVDYVGWPVSWLVDRLLRPRPGAQGPAGQPVGRAAQRVRRPGRRAAGGDRQRAHRARRARSARRCPRPGRRRSGRRPGPGGTRSRPRSARPSARRCPGQNSVARGGGCGRLAGPAARLRGRRAGLDRWC